MKPQAFISNSALLILTGYLCITSGCASSPRSVQSYGVSPTSIYGQSTIHSPHNVYHVVGPSETLWRISKTYGVSMQEIMRANNLDDPQKIKNGQELLIPNTVGAKPVVPLYPTRRWTHIVIHHTATADGDAYSIDNLHQKRGFWNGLGYHFLINNGTNGKEDGQIQVGPRWIKQMDGAHANADGMNEHGIGIVLVGNYSERHVTPKEIESLVFLVKILKNYYNIPDSHIIRHSDVPGKHTECPGLNFPWADFKRRVSN